MQSSAGAVIAKKSMDALHCFLFSTTTRKLARTQVERTDGVVVSLRHRSLPCATRATFAHAHIAQLPIRMRI